MAQPPTMTGFSSGFVTTLTSQAETSSASTPIAEEAIARDVDEDSVGEITVSSSSEEYTESDFAVRQFSSTNSYRRPSDVNPGARPSMIPSSSFYEHASSSKKHSCSSKEERQTVRDEERSLLHDNHLLPAKYPRRGSEEVTSSMSAWSKVRSAVDEESTLGSDSEAPSERTALLGGNPNSPFGALDSSKIMTTWQREAKVLTKSSAPLILTFMLQYSLTVASIFTVGHIGKAELGAVSLASMTASLTGYTIYAGLATSLDTLCAQAYGSGRPHLVGLQLQRMLYLLWCITIPIAIVWSCGTRILSLIVPEKETAHLAGLYLKILILGAPGYATFEAGKRYLQAQGIFNAAMYILLICAPLNALMHYIFVWQLELGFIGAPIAVVITENLMPILLFLYVRFVDGRQCWGGFNRRALQNWMPMIKLALPGLVMVLAEFMAFEILTLSASWLGPTPLAAQSILGSVTGITFQIPFPMSVAASTRIANLIGAALTLPAKTMARVAMIVAFGVGLFNLSLLFLLRNYIPRLFTQDEEVIDLVSKMLPLCAAYQLFDALACNCNGVLRGLGRQEIGGYVGLFAYYVVGLPLSFWMGFGLGWGLFGLWTGIAIALGIVFAIECVIIYGTSWERAVEEAYTRNSMG